MANILITERQLALITKEEKSKNSEIINEGEWYNIVGDVLGIFDPTGIVDFANAISYFSQGDHLFGLLSLISAIPIAGDIVAKPVMGALKVGGGATRGLNSAMKLAQAGKTVEASAMLAKLAEKPGVVGTFLQGAKNWAPKVASKVDNLPGGLLKGFKNTILDYLKLLENAGLKSVKFQKSAGILAKNLKNAAKPAESIGALKNLLKNDKVFKGLTKKGPLSKIFLGGAPRLFGNREMRILMRRTKWWLGFLDYIGVANFVGPDELAKQMGEGNIRRKMEEYNQTQEAQSNAEYDFGNENVNQQNQQTTQTQQPTPTQTDNDPIQGFLSDIFGGTLKSAAMMAI